MAYYHWDLTEITRDFRLLAVSVFSRQYQFYGFGKLMDIFLCHLFSYLDCDRNLIIQNVKVFLVRTLLYMKYTLCFIVSRGIFNQGYLCLKCGLGAHKECLGRLEICGKTGEMETF